MKIKLAMVFLLTAFTLVSRIRSFSTSAPKHFKLSSQREIARMTVADSTALSAASNVAVTDESWSDSSLPAPAVHIYPYSRDALSALAIDYTYSHAKVLHIVRHAEGYHNVNKDYRSMQNLDARLTDYGKEQCRALASRIQQADDPVLEHLASDLQLVVTSPLTRTMQTALLSLEPVLQRQGNDNKPPPLVLAHEMIRETVNYNCDRRRNLKILDKEFGHIVDLTCIETDHDAIWEDYVQRLGDHDDYSRHRESGELHLVADRARMFFSWLAKRPEEHVLLCSHAAFLRCLWNFGLGEKVPMQPSQDHDMRGPAAKNHPIVQIMGDSQFEDSLRKDYDNCELRSMVLAFPK